MAGLVVSDKALAALAHDPVLFLWSGHDALDGVVHLIHGDFGELATGRQDGRFVKQVGQVGTGEAGGAAGDPIEVHILGEGFAPGVNPQDLEATAVVGPINHHLAVKTTGPHQGRIKHVRAIGGRNDDDAVIALKAIHLGEQLVEGLLPFVVAAAQTGAPLTADGINFIDEDDARGIFLGLFEQIAHPAGTNADKHLDKFRA